MKKTVIKKGKILVKKDGILYELDHCTFNKIRTIIFDAESPLCKYCKKRDKGCRRQIEEEYITDGLTLKDRESCEYVFNCENNERKAEETYDTARLVWFGPDIEELTNDEQIIKHYGDAYGAHICSERVKKYIHKF